MACKAVVGAKEIDHAGPGVAILPNRTGTSAWTASTTTRIAGGKREHRWQTGDMSTKFPTCPPNWPTSEVATCETHRTRVHDKTKPLAPGTPAPDFALRAAPYRTVTLADFGGRSLILVFYIADWHPVCSGQLALYQDLLPEFRHLGAEVVGISADHLWAHGAFARTYGLSFPLLADNLPRGKIARRYGVFTPRTGACCRAVFVIDGDGVIRWSAAFPEAINPGADGIFTILEVLSNKASGYAQ
jgi:peroxiredoxin